MNDKLQDILNSPYRDKGAYKVPEGYFDALPGRLLAAAGIEQSKSESLGQPQAEPSKPRAIIVALQRAKYHIAAACVALAVAFTVALPYMTKNSKALASAEGETSLSGSSNSSDNTEQYMQDCYEYAMVDADDAYNYIITTIED
jgi:hypothetical protein